MNVTVIYESEFGATKRLADAVTAGLAESTWARAVSARGNAAGRKRAALFVLGTPGMGGAVMREWIAGSDLEGRPVALFTSRHAGDDEDGNASVAAAALAAGGTPFGAPASFEIGDDDVIVNETEIARARAWGQQLGEAIMATRRHPGAG